MAKRKRKGFVSDKQRKAVMALLREKLFRTKNTKKMVLFHGTVGTPARGIAKKGLRGGTFFTGHPREAHDFITETAAWSNVKYGDEWPEGLSREEAVERWIGRRGGVKIVAALMSKQQARKGTRSVYGGKSHSWRNVEPDNRYIREWYSEKKIPRKHVRVLSQKQLDDLWGLIHEIDPDYGQTLAYKRLSKKHRRG